MFAIIALTHYKWERHICLKCGRASPEILTTNGTAAFAAGNHRTGNCPCSLYFWQLLSRFNLTRLRTAERVRSQAMCSRTHRVARVREGIGLRVCGRPVGVPFNEKAWESACSRATVLLLREILPAASQRKERKIRALRVNRDMPLTLARPCAPLPHEASISG